MDGEFVRLAVVALVPKKQTNVNVCPSQFQWSITIALITCARRMDIVFHLHPFGDPNDMFMQYFTFKTFSIHRLWATI